MSLEELKKKRQNIRMNAETTLKNMNTIACESSRVSNIAHNSREILGNLDREFESQTGLKGADIDFLFFATGLQCARIFLINNLTKIEKAGYGNRNEDFLHDFQDRILNKFDNNVVSEAQPYKAPLNQIISIRGVPYDATSYLNENYKLFKGANHRFSTLGHDPVLGFVFGTANILTNTITCINKPIVTTNHVVYDMNFKNPRIGQFASSIKIFEETVKRLKDDKKSVVAAIIKQAIHISTDMYTTCGIQLPAANLILSKDKVEELTKFSSIGDIIKGGVSADLAELINTIISTIHGLLYDETKDHSIDVYSVKTKKIVLYSNVIASTSNVIWVGGNIMSGNEAAVKDLDVGGLIITLNRIMNDTKFIRELKEEFVFGGFKNMIRGEQLNLKEVRLWE